MQIRQINEKFKKAVFALVYVVAATVLSAGCISDDGDSLFGGGVDHSLTSLELSVLVDLSTAPETHGVSCEVAKVGTGEVVATRYGVLEGLSGDGQELYAVANLEFDLVPGEYRLLMTPQLKSGEPNAQCIAGETQMAVDGDASNRKQSSFVAYKCTGELQITAALNFAPVVNETFVSPGRFVEQCMDVVLEVAATDPDGDLLTYEWSLATGPEDGGFRLAAQPGDGSTAIFSGEAEGKYVVQVAISDGNGGSAGTTFNLHVSGNDDFCIDPDECVLDDDDMPVVGDVLYVDENGPRRGNDGLTWATAFTNLQAALDVAKSANSQVTEIWVAAGTYKPTKRVGGAIDVYNTFQLINGVAIYGGFAGNETARNQRDWRTNETVLTCRLGGLPNTRCYHVFYHPSGLNLDETAKLNGVIIERGEASLRTGNHRAGGGMHNNGSSPSIQNTIFRNNTARIGGAMYNKNSSPVICGSRFEKNSAGTVVYDGGGAIYNDGGGEVKIGSSWFFDNTGNSGGAIYNDKTNMIVVGTTFEANKASESGSGRGGGAIINLDANDVVIKRSVFLNNTATISGGGAMVNNNTSPYIVETEFLGNKAPDGGSNRGGGAILNYNGSPLIEDSLFQDNQAGSMGGAILNQKQSTPYITDTTFESNRATGTGQNRGGGAINSMEESYSTIISSTFSYNFASDKGGAILSNNSGAYIKDSVFLGNISDSTGSDGGGGALYASGNKTGTLVENSIFEVNQAVYSGGAIYNNNSNVAVVGGLLVGNRGAKAGWSGKGGGAIYTDSGNFILLNSTVWGNWVTGSTGGAILTKGTTLSVWNSILWGNTLDGNPHQIGVSGNNQPVITYSIVQGGATGANGNLNADPLFRDPRNTNGDFRLSSQSPAIDAGDKTLLLVNEGAYNIEVDLAGRDRVRDGDGDGVAQIDMGAYEF